MSASLSSMPRAQIQTEATKDLIAQMQRFRLNRVQFPSEQLTAYAGQWVAWNRDGTEILAHASRPFDLQAALAEKQLTLQEVRCERISSADEALTLSDAADFD